jgi:hypothetical protein
MMQRPAPSGSQATFAMEINGTLARDAELRNRVLDASGLNVPVICLDLVGTGPAQMPVHVEWPQPADGYPAAERLIKTLKRGTTVTVQAPWVGMRLVACNASQVLAQQATAGAPALTSPQLF